MSHSAKGKLARHVRRPVVPASTVVRDSSRVIDLVSFTGLAGSLQKCVRYDGAGGPEAY